MFAKSGFVLRSLVVTFFVGSLVACTFDQEGIDDEEMGTSSSEVENGKNKGGALEDDDATLDPYGEDGGPDHDGGPYDHDGGPYDHDGGPYDHDGGPYDHDGGPRHDGGPHHDGGPYDQDGGRARGDAGGGW